MKVIFFGTPTFAANVLKYLIDHHINIVATVTQPDKERKKTSKKQVNVKQIAEKYLPNIPLLQPKKASDSTFIEALKKFHADLFVVVAYGQILSQELIDIPILDIINVHASLLPKYRGAAPIERAIMEGETETGITIMKIVKQLDAGDIIDVEKVSILPDMNASDLRKVLCDIAKPLALKAIKNFEESNIKYFPQDNSIATYAPKISVEERNIDWSWPAEKISCLIRALSPFPGAECKILFNSGIKRLKIKKSKVVDYKGKIGEVLSFEKDRFIVACKEKALLLSQVQLEGKKTMSAEEFIRGIKEKIFVIIS